MEAVTNKIHSIIEILRFTPEYQFSRKVILAIYSFIFNDIAFYVDVNPDFVIFRKCKNTSLQTMVSVNTAPLKPGRGQESGRLYQLFRDPGGHRGIAAGNAASVVRDEAELDTVIANIDVRVMAG
jgi:hypothetical protein